MKALATIAAILALVGVGLVVAAFLAALLHIYQAIDDAFSGLAETNSSNHFGGDTE